MHMSEFQSVITGFEILETDTEILSAYLQCKGRKISFLETNDQRYCTDNIVMVWYQINVSKGPGLG